MDKPTFLPDTNLSLSDRVTPFLFLENDGQDYYLEIGGWGSGANFESSEATFQLSKRGAATFLQFWWNIHIRRGVHR